VLFRDAVLFRHVVFDGLVQFKRLVHCVWSGLLVGLQIASTTGFMVGSVFQPGGLPIWARQHPANANMMVAINKSLFIFLNKMYFKCTHKDLIIFLMIFFFSFIVKLCLHEVNVFFNYFKTCFFNRFNCFWKLKL
jgi:hypothetical protein